jgi:hypothetical protein
MICYRSESHNSLASSNLALLLPFLYSLWYRCLPRESRQSRVARFPRFGTLLGHQIDTVHCCTSNSSIDLLLNVLLCGHRCRCVKIYRIIKLKLLLCLLLLHELTLISFPQVCLAMKYVRTLRDLIEWFKRLLDPHNLGSIICVQLP